MEFTKQTVEPLYQQVKNYIARNIDEQIWDSGEKIPSEEKLAEICQVNRLTARKAITELVKVGALVRRPKRGTYVALQRKKHKKRTFKIGFFSSSEYRKYIMDPYFAGMFNGVMQSLSNTSYHMIYENCAGNYLDKIYGLYESIDGAIFTSGTPEEIVYHAIGQDLPFVFLDYILDNVKDYCSVMTDYVAGTGTALKYLYDLGHRKFGVLAPNFDNFVKDRQLSGIENALKSFAPDAEIFIKEVLYDVKSPYTATVKLLKQDMPTALFLCEDAFINGCITAIEEAGMNIPRDISIIGGEGVKTIGHLHPFSVNRLITTLQTDVCQIGRLGVEKLFEYISKGKQPESVLISQKFIKRGTCNKKR